MMVRSGFSLVELSIVLVILGLLIGGVLTGQNLIRAAELRSVMTEFKTYQTAVMTFRDKYFALPRDMTNATDFFWGGGDDQLRRGQPVWNGYANL
ncbi:prepilin-type N-terminal cleavage/methylation domain-containing protein [Mameliella alba]|nr:prepilin-type N-terminal cleavage/methylation domain-containing protein [Antarctobacter heliothermus]MBY6147330.1 prepilin-type N-terminal cleavage/methylation domain-containing protein [Mameliella alba]MCA0957392.1 prepilin-type N-terminal cleavage/methylation domain-containing protein [Mameliella alba]